MRLSVRVRSVVGILALVSTLAWPNLLPAAPIPVHFAEGVAHGFLLLRSTDGALLATGDLLQFVRDGVVEKRMVFHFTDTSVFEETVLFTESGVYNLQSYRLSQRGPAFPQDIEISMQRTNGAYRVKTKDRESGREQTYEGTIELPADVYNGLILSVVKDLPKGSGETVHYVAFTPEPRLIELQIAPSGEQEFMVGARSLSAIHYVLKPQLGIWLTFFATVVGRYPADHHVWIAPQDVPAFVRYEGSLYPGGPVWRIELTSPRWPD